MDVPDTDASAKLAAWFEDRWEDPFSVDVTGDLLGLLDECWARPRPPEPYLVYLKMAYHLSQEARDGLITYGLPADLRATLLEHQAVAAQFAAGALDRLGGMMIGDVVGLGKTLGRGGCLQAAPGRPWGPGACRVPQEPQTHVGGILRRL